MMHGLGQHLGLSCQWQASEPATKWGVGSTGAGNGVGSVTGSSTCQVLRPSEVPAGTVLPPPLLSLPRAWWRAPALGEGTFDTFLFRVTCALFHNCNR